MPDQLTRYQFGWVSTAMAVAVLAHVIEQPAWLWLSMLAVLALRAAQRWRQQRAISRWLRVPLTGALVGAIVLHHGTILGPEPGSALAAGLLALKMLETEKPRDARVALGFAVFVLMSALLFGQSLWFTIVVCAALGVVLAALVTLEPARLAPQPRKAAVRQAGWLLLAGLPLAFAAFAFIPRLATPWWGTPGAGAQGKTGLSDRMSPGSLGELLLDDSPALRVSFDGTLPPPAQRYFRAIVLTQFDGSAWTRGQRWQVARIDGPPPADAVHQEIMLEASGKPWLPALDLPLTAPPRAHLSHEHTLVSPGRNDRPRAYSVISSPDQVHGLELAPGERAQALALPDGFDPKARAQAVRWRLSGMDDAAIVNAALDLFRNDFSYTLTPPLLGRHSIDDFLYGTQAGYCEHYASAFTVLMRAAGIPARVVIGYQGGWWHASQQYLLVRQSDAHAWTELWLPQRGWLRVDPTAAVSPARVDLGAPASNRSNSWPMARWWLGARNRLDGINHLWTRAIIQFDAGRQRGLLRPLGIKDAQPQQLLKALLLVLLVAMAAGSAWVLWRRPSVSGDALDAAWRRLQRRLAKAGAAMAPSEGPHDAAQRIAPLLANGTQLQILARQYARLRYAVAEPQAEQVQELQRAISDFQPRLVSNEGRRGARTG